MHLDVESANKKGKKMKLRIAYTLLLSTVFSTAVVNATPTKHSHAGRIHSHELPTSELHQHNGVSMDEGNNAPKPSIQTTKNATEYDKAIKHCAKGEYKCLRIKEAKIILLDRYLSIGMKGDDVYLLNRELKSLGYGIPEGDLRYFWPPTHNAVVDFQLKHGIEPNGIVDERTADAIITVAK